MRVIPCEDCIVLARCRARILCPDGYFVKANRLSDICSMFREYVEVGIRPDTLNQALNYPPEKEVDLSKARKAIRYILDHQL